MDRDWQDAILGLERREREAFNVIDRHNARIRKLEAMYDELNELVEALGVSLIRHVDDHD